MADKECVKVVVRCRPFSDKEKTAGHACIVNMHLGKGQVQIVDVEKPVESAKSFTFDSVWDWNTQQRDFYNKTARPLVESVLGGYNGTIFAYGQTGTGKTFSMEGVRDVPDLRGIIPNSFEHIFSHIQLAGPNNRFLVRASYLEIYNEEIRDLLNPQAGLKLDVKEHPESGVYVKDLSSFVVKNSEEMEKLMAVGNKSRSVGFTEMNARSSRSHSIFTITVEMSEVAEDGKDLIRVGKLHLVDLAGSERQSKTGATGDRLKEATKINLSLSCLGNVIKALVDGKSSHIPYRDSKLTRLLQDSLGGNAKTMMVATLSPASYNYEETISTLRYASRAKNIKNKPKVNEDPKDAMLREFQEEIQRLREQLEQAESGNIPEGLVGLHATDEDADEEEEEEEEEENEEADDSIAQSTTTIIKADDDALTSQKLTKVVHRRCNDQQQQQQQSNNQTNVLQHGGFTDQELTDMQESIEKEKNAILQSKDMIESEKERILFELTTRGEDLERERRQREELSEKIKQMESKLLVGGVNILDKEAQQREDLASRVAELEEQRRQQIQLQQELMQEEEQALQMEEEYSSLQEEVTVKTGKIRKLWNVLQSHRYEITDLTAEFQREREDLLDTVRDLSRELKLRMKIVERFIPDDELGWIEGSSEWDEASEHWQIRNVSLAGNNVKIKKQVESSNVRGASSKAHTFRSSYSPEADYNRFVPALPNNSIFLTYDTKLGVGSGLRKNGSSPNKTSANSISTISSARSPSSRNVSKGNSANSRVRPQAARVKSGTHGSSARTGRSNDPTIVTRSTELMVQERDSAPSARGLVQKGRHYA